MSEILLPCPFCGSKAKTNLDNIRLTSCTSPTCPLASVNFTFNRWNSRTEIDNLRTENKRLHDLIHTPHTDDFMEAVPLEAAFQIDHWGTGHDDGKTPLDWFWLIGYLSQKIVVSLNNGDEEKAKHHCISTAATLLNWYRKITGDDNSFRPGIAEPTEIKFQGK
jgi:hypothetical protein